VAAITNKHKIFTYNIFFSMLVKKKFKWSFYIQKQCISIKIVYNQNFRELYKVNIYGIILIIESQI
jgi:hypothetical protein